MVFKICIICKREYEVNSNIQKYCKKCKKEAIRKIRLEYYKNNKLRLKEESKKYNIKHKEGKKKYNKKYYDSNKEEIIKYQKNYYKNHKEEKKEYNKEYRENNKEELSKKIKIYYKENKSKINKKHNKYKVKRYSNDINFRIMEVLRSRLNKALKNNFKSAETIKLLGCSINELKQHLEKQFKKGMSWDNYGFHGWHIDHIIPCSSFDLNKLYEQEKCFHYTNLQPLWMNDNLKKGGKILDDIGVNRK